jgi:hypothetical protein
VTGSGEPAARSGALSKLIAVVCGLALAGGAVVYYRYPPFAARELARLTGKAGFLPRPTPTEARVDRSNWPQNASVIAQAVRGPLQESNEILRIDEMRRRPDLLIEGSTLVFDANTPARIATSKLTLRNSTLVTNGGDLDIEVETLVADNSEIRAFLLSDSAPAKGAGRDAGKVRIVVHGRLSGVLRVDLGGQAGAAGAPGRPGAAGAAGSKGADARSAADSCVAKAGAGTAGAPGGRGEDGSDGSAGGHGGEFTLVTKNPNQAAGHIEFSAEGGRGGAGGAGGPGGQGGPGGPGGEPAGLCIGAGPTGPRGAEGAPGKPGQPGATGAAGSMRTLMIGEKG